MEPKPFEPYTLTCELPDGSLSTFKFTGPIQRNVETWLMEAPVIRADGEPDFLVVAPN